jgi:hypothetical protein
MPAAAGYSGTPLPKKLGIKDGHRVAILGAPATFAATLGDLPIGVTIAHELTARGAFDVLVCFVSERKKLQAGFARWAARLDPSGGLWIAWPKRASGVPTDVTEDAVRAVALAAGLVDNKVCAIDEVWSGLRCVVRVADRPKPAVKTRAPRAASAARSSGRRA